MRLRADNQCRLLRPYTRLMGNRFSSIAIVVSCQANSAFTSSQGWTIWCCGIDWKLSRKLVLDMSRHANRMRWRDRKSRHPSIILSRKLSEAGPPNLGTKASRRVQRYRPCSCLALIVVVTTFGSTQTSILFSISVLFPFALLPSVSLLISSITTSRPIPSILFAVPAC